MAFSKLKLLFTLAVLAATLGVSPAAAQGAPDPAAYCTDADADGVCSYLDPDDTVANPPCSVAIPIAGTAGAEPATYNNQVNSYREQWVGTYMGKVTFTNDHVYDGGWHPFLHHGNGDSTSNEYERTPTASVDAWAPNRITVDYSRYATSAGGSANARGVGATVSFTSGQESCFIISHSDQETSGTLQVFVNDAVQTRTWADAVRSEAQEGALPVWFSDGERFQPQDTVIVEDFYYYPGCYIETAPAECSAAPPAPTCDASLKFIASLGMWASPVADDSNPIANIGGQLYYAVAAEDLPPEQLCASQ